MALTPYLQQLLAHTGVALYFAAILVVSQRETTMPQDVPERVFRREAPIIYGGGLICGIFMLLVQFFGYTDIPERILGSLLIVALVYSLMHLFMMWHRRVQVRGFRGVKTMFFFCMFLLTLPAIVFEVYSFYI